ncbi:MAG: DUF1993 domain-containing protein [Candidatus Kaiserbacteria bacterium]|nr:DUF1993 domain-containing protein [Candidatus Kaiserbacteria bacterium]
MAQTTSLYTITIPQFIKTLTALRALVEKAQAHAATKKTERLDFESALLNDRLVFDQFPFVRQIQIAADNAKNSAARLGGVDVPKFEDNEQTFGELLARLDKTIEFLKTVKPADIDGKEDVKVSLPYWGGKSMNGLDYVLNYLIPNFYFHATTAYDILRKNGISIGKGDYIGALPFAE